MNKADAAKLEQFRTELIPTKESWREGKLEEAAFDMFMRWKILNDLYFFGAKVMGWEGSHSGKRWRLDKKFHRWLARVLELEENKMVLVPRNHLKTTWVKLRVVQLILRNPNVRVILASSTSTLVSYELADIVKMFQNPIIRRLFPTVVPPTGKKFSNWEKCTHDELTIRRDPSLGHVPQEPQIRAVGAESKITGLHCDFAFIDDIVDKDSVTSIEAMKKTEDWWAYFQSIIEVDAHICVTGTFYHDSDLYHKIWRERHFDRVFIRPAIENGKPIYSSWFRLKDLERLKRTQGSYIFNRQYMLDPNPSEERMFPKPYPTYSVLPEGKYRTYVAVDPAATTNSWSDESGFTIGYVSDKNVLYVVESFGVKLKGNELIDMLMKKFIQYKPDAVGMELGLQEHLTSILQMKISEWESKSGKPFGMNLVPIKISRNKSKAMRINMSLGAAMREGKVFMHESCKNLMLEMEFFSGREGDKDNLVDSASMLFYTCPTFAQHYWTAPQSKRNMWTVHSIYDKPKSGWEERFAG